MRAGQIAPLSFFLLLAPNRRLRRLKRPTTAGTHFLGGGWFRRHVRLARYGHIGVDIDAGIRSVGENSDVAQ